MKHLDIDLIFLSLDLDSIGLDLDSIGLDLELDTVEIDCSGEIYLDPISSCVKPLCSMHQLDTTFVFL